MADTVLIVGIKAMSRFLSRSERYMAYRVPLLVEAGVLFRQWRGAPPRQVWCAWSDDLKDFARLGEARVRKIVEENKKALDA